MSDGRARIAEVVRNEVAVILSNEGMGQLELSDDMSLLDDVGLSSLAMLDLMVGLERALCCRFDDLEGWASMDASSGRARFTVGSVVDAVFAAVTVMRALPATREPRA